MRLRTYTATNFSHLLLALVFAHVLLVGCSQQQPNRTAAANPSLVFTGVWATEGGSPDRSRATNENITPPLVLSAEFKIGGDTQFSSPVTLENDLLLAEGDKRLHALEMNSGKQRWEVPVAGSYLSPTIADGIVVVRAETGEDGYVVALDSQRGTKLWEFKFPSVGSAQGDIGGHVTSPVVVDGKVLVGAGYLFTALDVASGKLLWSFDLSDPVASSAAVADGTLYVVDFKHLYALDVASGAEQWRFEHTTTTLLFAPIVAGERVFVTDGMAAFALNRADGAVLWSRTLSDKQLIPAAALADEVYMKSATELFVLDAASGEPRWIYRTLNYVSMPALTTEFAFVVTRADGGSQLRVLRRSDGSEVWKSDNLALTNGAPVIASGLVFIRTIDGRVLGFQAQKE